MSEIERLITENDLSGDDAREVRAFSRFLSQVDPPPWARVQALDHWAVAYINGGPTPPLRWEGDDS